MADSNSPGDGVIQKQLQEGRRALAKADAESQKIQRALRKSRKVRRQSIPKLKKAGYLR